MRSVPPQKVFEIQLNKLASGTSNEELMKVSNVSSLSAAPGNSQLFDCSVLLCRDGSTRSSDIPEEQSMVKIDSKVDALSQGRYMTLCNEHSFNGGAGKFILTHSLSNTTNSASLMKDVALFGLGKIHEPCMQDGSINQKGLDSHTAYNLGCMLGQQFKQMKSVRRLCVMFHPSDVTPNAFQCMLEAVYLELTSDDRFKKSKMSGPGSSASSADKSKLEEIVWVPTDGSSDGYAAAAKHAKYFSRGALVTRDLVNSPANVCNTESLANTARTIAKECGLSIDVLGDKECREKRMGAYLAVHQGSMYEPQFIHMKMTADSTRPRKVVLIGKGLCMDTGGYNLKVSCGIETMKLDMGGAGAVLGAARILADIKQEIPDVEVHYVIAAAENMISATAIRPGDIVSASNGTTIEIGNTDAEGRLTLADALLYAVNDIKADYIIDCATLTGAAMVALGENIAALYSNNSEFSAVLSRASQESGELVWPMPIYMPYRKHIESPLADLNNCPTSRYGSSITAALFLAEFVPKTTSWCHVDMAGPVFSSTSKLATGFGARMLAKSVKIISAAPQ